MVIIPYSWATTTVHSECPRCHFGHLQDMLWHASFILGMRWKPAFLQM